MKLSKLVERYAIERRRLAYGSRRQQAQAAEALEVLFDAMIDAVMAPETWDDADRRAYRTLQFWREFGFRVPDTIVSR